MRTLRNVVEEAIRQWVIILMKKEKKDS
jgi:hypothetical protein